MENQIEYDSNCLIYLEREVFTPVMDFIQKFLSKNPKCVVAGGSLYDMALGYFPRDIDIYVPAGESVDLSGFPPHRPYVMYEERPGYPSVTIVYSVERLMFEGFPYEVQLITTNERSPRFNNFGYATYVINSFLLNCTKRALYVSGGRIKSLTPYSLTDMKFELSDDLRKKAYDLEYIQKYIQKFIDREMTASLGKLLLQLPETNSGKANKTYVDGDIVVPTAPITHVRDLWDMF